MKARFITGALAIVAVLALTALPAGARRNAPKPVTRYYLALGDSLSVGYQPDGAGGGAETTQGYADQLYANLRRRIRHLKLVKLGCPGESTASMISGKGNEGSAAAFHCRVPQLSAAERFLKAHHRRREVALVTIDIGANDVDGCIGDASNLGPCLSSGEAAIRANEPKILGALRRAAPKGTSFASMDLYDPVLAAYLSPSSPLNPFAEPSVQLTEEVNADIDAAARAARFRIADVFDAFRTTDQTPTTYAGQSVPTNVAEICVLTWMCSSFQNIHANRAGYGVIARAFEKAISRIR
jgi:lysophospholipase L1-like esterase